MYSLPKGIGSAVLFSQAVYRPPNASYSYVMVDRIAELPHLVWGKIIFSSPQLFMVLSNYSKRTTDANLEQHICRAYEHGPYIATMHFVIVTYLISTSLSYLLLVWK